MGDGGKPPYGGNRLQRGFIDGGDRPMGETAPNAVLFGGNRPQRGFIERLLRYL